MTWYRVSEIESDGIFHPNVPEGTVYTALKVGTEWYVLTNEILEFPTLTEGEVEATGLNYNRTITGA